MLYLQSMNRSQPSAASDAVKPHRVYAWSPLKPSGLHSNPAGIVHIHAKTRGASELSL